MVCISTKLSILLIFSKKHKMLDSKPAKSPSCPNTHFSLHKGNPLPDPNGYRSLVGAFHYLTFTRPEISFSVHQVCQYMSAPTIIHLVATKRILRHIRGTLFHGVAFTPSPLHLSAYTDATGLVTQMTNSPPHAI